MFDAVALLSIRTEHPHHENLHTCRGIAKDDLIIGADTDGSRAVSLSVNSWPHMRIHLFGCYHFGVSEKFCSVVKSADCLVRQQDL